MRTIVKLVVKDPATIIFNVNGLFREKDFRDMMFRLKAALEEISENSVTLIVDFSQAQSTYNHIFRSLSLLNTEYREILERQNIRATIIVRENNECWTVIQTLLAYYHLEIPLVTSMMANK